MFPTNLFFLVQYSNFEFEIFYLQVDLLPSGVVRLDNWINVKMPAAQAALICALRPAVEAAVTRASEDPETGGMDERLEGIIRELVRVDAPRHGMEPISSVSAGQVREMYWLLRRKNQG